MTSIHTLEKFKTQVSLGDILAIRELRVGLTYAWFGILFVEAKQFEVFDIRRNVDATEPEWDKALDPLNAEYLSLVTAWTEYKRVNPSLVHQPKIP